MESFDEGARRRSDGEMETMLREFFATEIPEVLAPLPQRPASLDSAPSRPWSNRFGFIEWIAYAALAASVLMVIGARLKFGNGVDDPAAVAAIAPPSQELAPAAERLPDVPAANELAAGDDAELGNVEYTVLERQDPVQKTRFVTSEGAFERQTIVRWRICSVYEPRTGERVQWSTPMVSISVSPAAKNSGPGN